MKFYPALLLLLLLTTALQAKTGRYRMSWRSDPATSAVIGFEQFSGTNARVVYDHQDHGEDPAAYRFTANPARKVNSHGMRNLFVRLQRLRPGTIYYFIVLDDEGRSPRMKFETPPDDPSAQLSIVAGGDSRNNRDVARVTNRIVGRLQPHFVLFGGDMTNGDSDIEWQEWLDDWQLTMSDDGRLTPIVPARGNHEDSNETITELFDIASPTVTYALDFGGGLLRTYTLNTLLDPGGSQREWLGADLATSRARWKIAQYHHPMRPHTARKRENDNLIYHWASLFTAYGVDLVVECDAHMVKQTYPIRPHRGLGADEGFIRDDERGTVYVGEGCWGAPLRANNDDKKWTRASGSFNQVKWIWVSPTDIQVRTIVVDRSGNLRGGVDRADRFRTPPGLYYWDAPNGGDVLYVRNTPAPASAPPQYTVPAPARIEAPAAPASLRRDATNRVRVAFTLAQTDAVEAIVIGPNNRLLWRQTLPIRGPGPYTEMLQLPTLPTGQPLELILKTKAGLLGKYRLY